MTAQDFQWLNWSGQQARHLLCIDVSERTPVLLSELLHAQLRYYFRAQNQTYQTQFKLEPANLNTVTYQHAANSSAVRGIEGCQKQDTIASLFRNIATGNDGMGQQNSVDTPPFFSTTATFGQQYRAQLGGENRLVLADMRQSFNPDVIAALAGTVIGGGVMIVFVSQQQTPSNVLRHFIQGFKRYNSCHYVNVSREGLEQDWQQIITNIFSRKEPTGQNDTVGLQGHAARDKTNFDAISPNKESEIHNPHGAVNSEQHQTIEDIIKVATGRRDRPLVITADRGRGKTTSLALASIQLLQQRPSPITIIITAPTPAAVKTYFRHLQQCPLEISIHALVAEYRQHKICFVPVDELIENPRQCQLLLIDEAAGIPIAQLQRLSECYHRLVFSSTVHGYEGAGRGFTHKFLTYLHQTYTNSRQLHLNSPVRWSQQDEVEPLLFERFFLNAGLPILPAQYREHESLNISSSPDGSKFTFEAGDLMTPSTVTGTIRYQWLQGKELLEREEIFAQAFAMLVAAHYQTKPSDLKLLLDEESVFLGLQFMDVTSESGARQGETLLSGVALIMIEGDLSTELIDKVNLGQRRIPGQFTPQSLMTQANVDWAFDFRYARVVRIAVHPDLQGHGLGNQLIRACESFATDKQLDCLSTSFGVNQSLFHFWHQANFKVARLGFTRDKASGEFSILMLKPLHDNVADKVIALEAQWRSEWAIFLPDEHRELSSSLVALLLSATTVDTQRVATEQLTSLGAQDIVVIEHFIQGTRQLSSCMPALQRLLMSLAKADYSYVKRVELDACYDGSPLALLVGKVLQKQSFLQLAKRSGLSGQKAVVTQLKTACKALLQARSLQARNRNNLG